MDKTTDIKSVVFDLDGTLMQSSSTIYKTTIKTLEEFNIKPAFTETDFNTKIGYHFKDIFDELNIDISDLEYFIDVYKSNYFNYIDDSKFYPNVFETLEDLNKNKIKTSILTTKAQDQADKIVDHFDVRKYFGLIEGRRNGIKLKPAPDALLKICKLTSTAPENTIMIGDSDLDILCGKAAGAFTCAVTYGYGGKEMLYKQNPDFVINDIRELLPLLNLK
jgi:phosphoglycolate phosphatase